MFYDMPVAQGRGGIASKSDEPDFHEAVRWMHQDGELHNMHVECALKFVISERQQGYFTLEVLKSGFLERSSS